MNDTFMRTDYISASERTGNRDCRGRIRKMLLLTVILVGLCAVVALAVHASMWRDW